MRITESQLRQIVRQEASRLARRPPAPVDEALMRGEHDRFGPNTYTVRRQQNEDY